jgi:DNA polymerase-3 subunit chi
VRIDFYHLTSAPLEKVLPIICEKLVATGERLLVVTDPPRLAELDRQLWSYASESFLPHAQVGKGSDAQQPILLADRVASIDGFRNIALADGYWRNEVLTFDRIFYFFDAGAIVQARSSWRTLKDQEGAERHYWKQDERGRWVEGP